MPSEAPILDRTLSLEAGTDLAAALSGLPAKACVALLRDGAGAPLQLLSGRDLRAVLRRRMLGIDERPEASRRRHVADEVGYGSEFEEPADPGEGDAQPRPRRAIDYASIVRRVDYARADSAFELDLLYLRAVREAFPERWPKLLPRRMAHFVAIDTKAAVPTVTRVERPDAPGDVFGPFAERSRAEAWIESLRDVFGLCRYPHVVQQAPHGAACTYKQIGRCEAPCDGSVPMARYQQIVSRAVTTVVGDDALPSQWADAMKSAASELAFERAGMLKARLGQLASLRQEARVVGAFRFVTVQPGPRAGSARLFAVDAAGAIEAGVVRLDRRRRTSVAAADVRALLTQAGATLPTGGVDAVWLGLVAHHLHREPSEGVWLHEPAEVTDDRLLDAIMRVTKSTPSDEQV